MTFLLDFFSELIEQFIQEIISKKCFHTSLWVLVLYLRKHVFLNLSQKRFKLFLGKFFRCNRISVSSICLSSHFHDALDIFRYYRVTFMSSKFFHEFPENRAIELNDPLNVIRGDQSLFHWLSSTSADKGFNIDSRSGWATKWKGCWSLNILVNSIRLSFKLRRGRR